MAAPAPKRGQSLDAWIAEQEKAWSRDMASESRRLSKKTKGYVSDLSNLDEDVAFMEKNRRNRPREGLMSDLPLAEQKAIRKRGKQVARYNQRLRAKLKVQSFFDRYTVEVVGGAVLAAASFAWILHKKKTTGSIW